MSRWPTANMPSPIKELGVVVGYGCNFKCAHCCTGRVRPRGLTKKEQTAVTKAIARYSPRTILFVGGETTLYLKTINSILSSVRNLSGSKITITTNGHFAGTRESSLCMLRSFRKLDSVQLSYDRFHAEFLPFENVARLYEACAELGIRFCVINTIASPMELLGLKKLASVGKLKVLVNKALPSGSAAVNGIEYPYPSFDRGVLRRSCPSHGNVSYICGRGFSICCAHLMFEADLPVANASIDLHKHSMFYKLMTRNTFGRLLRMSGLTPEGLHPRLSAECNLCLHIFNKGSLLSKLSKSSAAEVRR